MKFFDFFAGIGGFRLGMEMAGHEWVRYIESNNLIYPIAWMLLPKPYKGAVK